LLRGHGYGMEPHHLSVGNVMAKVGKLHIIQLNSPSETIAVMPRDTGTGLDIRFDIMIGGKFIATKRLVFNQFTAIATVRNRQSIEVHGD